MSLAQKVAHNTLIQFVGKGIGMVLALVTVSLMLRYLGRSGFGQYTTIMAYLSVFSIMADLGLYLVVTREISKKNIDQDKFVSNAMTIKGLSGLVILTIGSLVIWLFPYDPIVKWGVVVGASSYLFILLNQTLIGVFQKYFSMYKVAVAEVAGRIVWLIAVVLVIYTQSSILYMIFGIALSNLVNFLVLFFYSRKYVKVKLAFDFSLWKKILIMTAPLAFSVVFNLIYFKVDTLFLSIMKSESDVGVYGAAYKVLEVLITFAAIFAGLLLPVMSKFFEEDRKKFAEIYKKGFDVLIIFVVPLIIGTLFLAEPIMAFFGGVDFADSGNVLKLLIIATGAIFFSHLFGNAAVAANRQHKTMWVYIFTAILAVVLCLWLIPKYSYYGAAIATVVSEVSVAILTALIIWRLEKVGLNYKIAGKSLFAGIFMVIVLFLMPDSWNFAIRGLIAMAVYFGIAFLIKAILIGEVKEIISMRKDELSKEGVVIKNNDL